MLEFLATLALFLVVVEPLLVGVHEFGHATVPLAQGRRTHIFVGGDRGPTASIGALTLTLALPGFLRPITDGATLSDAATGRWTLLAGTLGGPVASLLACAGCWGLLWLAPPEPVWWFAFWGFLYSGMQAAITLLPFQARSRPGGEPFRTDGRIALELLLGRDPVLDEDGRWRVDHD